MAKYYFLTLFSLILIFKGYSIDDPKLKYIKDKFEKYSQNNYAQKIILNTDKKDYLTNENIWLSAYVINSFNLKADTSSGLLIIELINLNEIITHTQILKINNGFGSGQLYIHDSVPDGYYLLRAYTNYMKNFSDEMSFQKIIRIYNDSLNLKPFDRKIKKAKKEYDNKPEVLFLPNNGKLIEGMDNTCSFFINKNPENKILEANLYNDKNELITTVSILDNVGTFNITPADKTRYYIQLSDLKNKYYLPDSQKKDYLLSINELQDQFHVSINYKETNKLLSNIYLIGQNNLNIFFEKIITSDNINEEIKIDKEKLKNGVASFKLIDGRYNLLAEIYFFIENDNAKAFILNPIFQGDSVLLSYDFTIEKTDYLSLSIVDKANYFENDLDINSHIYLTSKHYTNTNKDFWYKLNGKHLSENTNVFVTNFSTSKDYWGDVFKETKVKDKYSFEKSITVSGIVRDDVFKYPVSNVKVTLSLLNQYYDIGHTNTDKEGRFTFNNLNYYDSLDVKLLARKKNGNKNVYIELDESDPYEITFYPSIYNPVQNELVRTSYPKTDLNLDRDSTALKGIYSHPDQVIYVKNGSAYKNVFDVIKGRVPGVMVNNDNISIRGKNTLYGNQDPLFLIDGTPISEQSAYNLNINDIERIEIVKGPQKAIFGMQGANGVIAIYSKRGFNVKRGELTFQMHGFIKPKKFYMSKNEQSLYQKYNIPKTLHWSALITQNNKTNTVKIPKSKESIEVNIQGMINDQPVTYIETIYFK